MTLLARADVSVPSRPRPSIAQILVGLTFFVSGFPALIYQLTWQRVLFAFYGTNVEAVTVVVAGFLLGLGLGSLAGGWASRTRAVPLLALFGAIELIIGAYGVFSLRILRFFGALTFALPIGEATALTLVLLFVPTLFMGSTLPILVNYLVRQSRNVGNAVGLLYCVNTAGSAAACFASAFGLMPLMGMQGAVDLAASLNLAVAACALIAAYRRQGGESTDAGWPSDDRPTLAAAILSPRHAFAFAIVMAALLGFISLSYEILWFRSFELATNTSAAFALILAAYLAGIANGSLRAHRYCDAELSPAQATWSLGLIVLAGSILGVALLPLAARATGSFMGEYVPMLGMIFVQMSIASAAFPILCHYGITPDNRAGARLGIVYVANIMGSVVGTLATGFVLMDHLSIAEISALLGIFGALVATALGLSKAIAPHRRRALIAIGLAVALTIPVFTKPLFDGFYENLTFKGARDVKKPFVELVENKSGVIAVDPDGFVYGGGIYDGIIEVDLTTDRNLLIRPFALDLFHPHPRDVLMVGLATGAWAQVIAGNPAVEHFTIVEINPGYLGIIKKYPVVAGILTNPKIEIVIDDGRRWLNRHPERKFDAIVQNTTWNFRPNVTNVLSEEYLRLARLHLKKGGILTYNTTWSARAQRTGCAVFAHGFRHINMMVVGDSPILLDRARLRASLANYRIEGRPVLDLSDAKQRQRLDSILAGLVPVPYDGIAPAPPLEDCASVLARTRGLALITDDNMGEEWRYLSATGSH